MSLEYRVGDVFERMAEIPDDSIDLIVTSPPFLALRSYLPADHPDKHKEIGSEPTPAEFIDTLLALTAEWCRVLAPHGSLCVELGDTYAGQNAAPAAVVGSGERWGQEGRPSISHASGTGPPSSTRGPGWPLPKSLTGIPTLYTWSLAYGRNLLTGEPSPAPQMRIRNLICWARPNPPVGALGDKFRPATSYITVACVGPKRYFDLDSVRSLGPTRPAVPSVSDALEVPTTLLTSHSLTDRGWCDTGRSKVAVGSSMTWETQRLQVVDPVGFLVGVEQLEGPQMMDLESVGAPADLALVPISVERILSGALPVASAVARSSTIPTGIVLASDVDAPPLTGTLEAAEVVSQDLALVAGKWLAARITLDLDGARRTAFVIAPVACSTHSEQSSSKYAKTGGKYTESTKGGGAREPLSGDRGGSAFETHTAGAPPLDWHADDHPEDGDWLWKLSTQPYKGSHYAAFPMKLPKRLIEAMCPLRVCTVCGVPSTRIVEQAGEYATHRAAARLVGDDSPGEVMTSGLSRKTGRDKQDGKTRVNAEYTTLGWTDCGHDAWRTGVTLDPFAGSGTTLDAAQAVGRHAIGIDIDHRNADLARERVGMFMEVAP